MEKTKNKLLIVLSTVCLIAILSIPCIASTVVPEADIVDDIQQGITVYTQYHASINDTLYPRVLESGNFIAPFNRSTYYTHNLDQDIGHTIYCRISEVNKPLTSDPFTFVCESTTTFEVDKSQSNTTLNYVQANSTFADFYIDVEYDQMTWKAITNTEAYQSGTVKIKYSLIGNPEVRLIELDSVLNVDICKTIKDDIVETYPNEEDFKVYVWGIETTAYTSSYETEYSYIYRTTQQLITDIDVIKMDKNNSRNTDLNAHGIYVMENYNQSFDNITRDWTTWIGEAIGGFMSFEIVPYVSIGGIFAILIAIALTNLFLKLFMGG